MSRPCYAIRYPNPAQAPRRNARWQCGGRTQATKHSGIVGFRGLRSAPKVVAFHTLLSEILVHRSGHITIIIENMGLFFHYALHDSKLHFSQ